MFGLQYLLKFYRTALLNKNQIDQNNYYVSGYPISHNYFH